jgi:hypothetical protein
MSGFRNMLVHGSARRFSGSGKRERGGLLVPSLSGGATARREDGRRALTTRPEVSRSCYAAPLWPATGFFRMSRM